MSTNLIRVVIQLPILTKRILDTQRNNGYTTSGYIRWLVEKDLIARGLLNEPLK